MLRKLVLTLVLGLVTPVVGAQQPVKLYKTPGCMCCEAYANYLRHRGFEVAVIASHDLAPMKAERGVPEDKAGCHTALIGGYTVDGHVPIDSVRRLLRDRPEIGGITVPGMPAGSPGMPGEMREPIRVWSFTDGQSGELFAVYEARPE